MTVLRSTPRCRPSPSALLISVLMHCRPFEYAIRVLASARRGRERHRFFTSAATRSLFAVVPWLLAAAALFPTSAAAHVVTPDLIVRDRITNTHPDELTEEYLPIVHECPQVAAIIRAEDMTEFELTMACLVLKDTEDRYHAKLRTDPAKPVKTWYDKVEVLIFRSTESMGEYYLEVFGRELTAAGVYYWPIDEEHHPWTFLPYVPQRHLPLGFWGDPIESID